VNVFAIVFDKHAGHHKAVVGNLFVAHGTYPGIPGVGGVAVRAAEHVHQGVLGSLGIAPTPAGGFTGKDHRMHPFSATEERATDRTRFEEAERIAAAGRHVI
jgi:hypothetical protein